MKITAAICLLLLSLHVRADMVITEVVESGGQSQNLTLKIKGDKVRTDVGTQMSTVTDTNTGDLITLIHAQKSYMKMSASKTKALMDQMRAMQGEAANATPAEKPKFTDTGKSEKVNDYNAEIFTAETPAMKLTYWVAKDFPNGAAVVQQMKKMQAAMESKLGPAATASAPDLTQLPGLPIKTQIEKGAQTIITTMVSAKEQPVDDGDLQVPADYKEIQMPNLGGAGGAPASAPAPSQP